MENRDIALEAFRRIMTANPHLEMAIVSEPIGFDAEMYIPKQDGLHFSVHLNLQGVDDLHLVTEPFYGEWFPCTDKKVFLNYISAVNGLLSGKHRIRVINRNGIPVKAHLQTIENDKWKTIYRYGRCHLPLGTKNIWYIRNM